MEMTVGDLRKLIKGKPNNAVVPLHIEYGEVEIDSIFIRIDGTKTKRRPFGIHLDCSLVDEDTVMEERDPTCYFRCDQCEKLHTASTSDVKEVGHPMCCDRETDEITKKEYDDYKLERAGAAAGERNMSAVEKHQRDQSADGG